MKRKLHHLHLLFVCLFVSFCSFAQDIHFSHIHASPTYINPGMNGLFNGSIRFIGNVRTQWQSVTKGYKTAAGSVDGVLKSVGQKDVIGAGLQLFSDEAGDLDFSTKSVAGNISFIKALDSRGNHYLSYGMQGAFMSNSVDFTKIVAFDDEPDILNDAANRITYFDFSAGLAYSYAINPYNYFHFGVAMWHLNEADVSFLNTNNLDKSYNLYRRVVIHGGGDFQIGRKSFLKPTFIYLDQGPHREITFGTFWKYKTLKYHNDSRGTALYLGAWLRTNFQQNVRNLDALVAAVRLDYKDTFFTFTFDINMSSLTQVSRGRGGPEFSVVKIIDVKKTRRTNKVRCPDF